MTTGRGVGAESRVESYGSGWEDLFPQGREVVFETRLGPDDGHHRRTPINEERFLDILGQQVALVVKDGKIIPVVVGLNKPMVLENHLDRRIRGSFPTEDEQKAIEGISELTAARLKFKAGAVIAERILACEQIADKLPGPMKGFKLDSNTRRRLRGDIRKAGFLVPVNQALTGLAAMELQPVTGKGENYEDTPIDRLFDSVTRRLVEWLPTRAGMVGEADPNKVNEEIVPMTDGSGGGSHRKKRFPFPIRTGDRVFDQQIYKTRKIIIISGGVIAGLLSIICGSQVINAITGEPVEGVKPSEVYFPTTPPSETPVPPPSETVKPLPFETGVIPSETVMPLPSLTPESPALCLVDPVVHFLTEGVQEYEAADPLVTREGIIGSQYMNREQLSEVTAVGTALVEAAVGGVEKVAIPQFMSWELARLQALGIDAAVYDKPGYVPEEGRYKLEAWGFEGQAGGGYAFVFRGSDGLVRLPVAKGKTGVADWVLNPQGAVDLWTVAAQRFFGDLVLAKNSGCQPILVQVGPNGETVAVLNPLGDLAVKNSLWLEVGADGLPAEAATPESTMAAAIEAFELNPEREYVVSEDGQYLVDTYNQAKMAKWVEGQWADTSLEEKYGHLAPLDADYELERFEATTGEVFYTVPVYWTGTFNKGEILFRETGQEIETTEIVLVTGDADGNLIEVDSVLHGLYPTAGGIRIEITETRDNGQIVTIGEIQFGMMSLETALKILESNGVALIGRRAEIAVFKIDRAAEIEKVNRRLTTCNLDDRSTPGLKACRTYLYLLVLEDGEYDFGDEVWERLMMNTGDLSDPIRLFRREVKLYVDKNELGQETIDAIEQEIAEMQNQ